MKRRNTLAIICCATSVLLLSTSCGNPVTPPPPTPVPTPVERSPEDRQAAEQALPTIVDFDSTYAATPFDPNTASAEDAELNACLGIEPTAVHETARAYSSIFTSGANKRVQFSVSFVDSADKAKADLGAYARDGAGECVRQSFLRQLSRTGNSPDVTQDRITPPPGGEGVSAGYRLIVQQQAGAPRVVDLVTAVRGRAEITATFISLQEPIPNQEEDRLIRRCLDRLGDP